MAHRIEFPKIYAIWSFINREGNCNEEDSGVLYVGKVGGFEHLNLH